MDSIYVFLAKYLFFIIALGVVAFGFRLKSDQRVKFFGLVLTSGIISYVLVKVASSLYFDPRPFTVSGIKPLVDHAADNGFPSEHTTYSSVLAFAVYGYNKYVGRWFILAAALVGAGRMLVHVHSINDVAGGIFIAAIAVLTGKAIVSKYFGHLEKILHRLTD